MTSALETFCNRNDLPCNDRCRERFDEYLRILLHFNESMNLIGPLDRDAVVRELLVDSLTPAALHPPEGRLLDVGSGAGLPGIPLKILYPGCSATLVEPRRKRSTFLRIARNRLELEDLRLEQTRIEELPAERFDYVVSKAFRSPEEWLSIAAERVSASGLVVCMTTPDGRRAIDRLAPELDLEFVGGVDDTAALGAPAAGDEARAVSILAPRSRPE